eukprot:8921557-Ditylum_brightwellii.AAC.1
MSDLQHIIHPEQPIDVHDTTYTHQHLCIVHALKYLIILASLPWNHSCLIFKCTSCILAKIHKVSHSTTHTKGAELGKLTQEDLHPGDRMSLDQYVVKHKGLTLCTASDSSAMYNGDTMFTDHALK